MRHPNSGLEVKDRTWLKLKISNAFLGSDLVEWLHEKVEGFQVSSHFSNFPKSFSLALTIFYTLKTVFLLET